MAPQAGVNGVLPVAVLQKNTPVQAPRGPKPAQPRLKFICRRLPPGLTKAEFESILGGEWKVGAGKVDWFSYRKGKISKDLAKPSKPARAYFHVIKQEYVKLLGDAVRAATFQDATKSWQDGALVGLPTVEYAPYPKLPGGRRRNDNRQGTIDQDQEFKDFLEGLTNPITKPAAPDADTQKPEKIKTTPLIEALREKKAARDKPSAKNSRTGRAEAKDEAADKKVPAKPGKENALGAVDKNRRPSKADKAQAAKEAIKILNKEAAATKDATAAQPDKVPAPPQERRRGNVALAKSMLQRDLGVGPGPTRRRGTKREVPGATTDVTPSVKSTASSDQKAKEAVASTVAKPADKSTQPLKKERPTRAERRAFKASLMDKPTTKPAADEAKVQTPIKPTPQILKKPQTPASDATPASASAPTSSLAPPKGPAASRLPVEPPASRHVASPQKVPAILAKPSSTPTAPVNTTTKPTQSPSRAPASKQAFLKHANPSQGITEPLIEEAFAAFGAIEKVEIDKRKGFAYVDFLEPEGLQKAMAASPVKIAQGAVQVLERKDKVARPLGARFNGPPTGPARGGRGGFAPRGRGRGGVLSAVPRGGSQIGAGSSAVSDAPAAATAPSAPSTPAPPAAGGSVT